jgi:hypothetical protein
MRIWHWNRQHVHTVSVGLSTDFKTYHGARLLESKRWRSTQITISVREWRRLLQTYCHCDTLPLCFADTVCLADWRALLSHLNLVRLCRGALDDASFVDGGEGLGL